MTSDFSRDRFRRPELFFQEVIRKNVVGDREANDNQFLFRALVVAVDVEGGNLENPDSSGGVEHNVSGKKFNVQARVGPSNPPNSIKARLLTDGFDKFSSDDNLKVFWPFFPENMSIPIKPGEHVYVLFEDASQQHGLWTSKVAGHVGVNYAPGSSFFVEQDGSNLSDKFSDTKGLSSSNSKKFDTDESAAETKRTDKLSSLFK